MPDSITPTRKIRPLPIQLANQIAAGEVVERPASVVKELVENSIDAGATKIIVDIEQGGHKKISVRDNGYGIPKEDITLALSRHATSKIYSLDELEHIHTMGFRGEALASISSVSRCRLTSKPKQQDSAWQAFAEGNDMEVSIQPAAHPNGTSVDVVDLFFNTPARRRFLRAQKTEFQHIEKVIKRIALAHPDLSFELIHNGKSQLRLNSCESFERVQKVFKQANASKLIKLKYKYPEVDIQGFISPAGEGFESNENQYLFINQRMMKDRLLMHAIRQAYEGFLPDAKFPNFVIFLKMLPETFDVNVHPAKHEVRFHRAREIHDALYQSINQTLIEHIDSKTTSDLLTKDDHLEAMKESYVDSIGLGNTTPNHSYIRPPEKQSSSELQESSYQSYTGTVSRSSAPGQANIERKSDAYQTLLRTDSTFEIPVICIGNYVLIKASDNVYLQTQEQIAYAFLLSNNYEEDSELIMQPLLMPVTVKPDSINPDIVDIINNRGFDVQIRSGKLVLLQVPAHLKHLPWTGLFADIFDRLSASDSNDFYRFLAQAWITQFNPDENTIKYWLTKFEPENQIWLKDAQIINEKILQGLL